jgi:hypothetical protein
MDKASIQASKEEKLPAQSWKIKDIQECITMNNVTCIILVK